jgi:hypothetical protein
VLELEDADLAPYTFDYTLRMEEAQAFAREVANYRSVEIDFMLSVPITVFLSVHMTRSSRGLCHLIYCVKFLSLVPSVSTC